MEQNEWEIKEMSKTIEVTDENGKVLQGEMICTFEINGEEFVIYEINEQVFASKMTSDNKLMPVNEDEWPLVEKIYNQYIEDLEAAEDELEGE